MRVLQTGTALLIGLLMITGCTSKPQPATSPEPTPHRRAALSVAKATAVVNHFRAIDTAARTKHSAAALKTVLTGPQLKIERARISYAKKSDTKPDGDPPPHDHQFRVLSTAAGSYPQLAVISGSAKKGGTADSNYLVERRTAADPWLIGYVTHGDLNTFLPEPSGTPTSSGTSQGSRPAIFTAVRPDTVVNGIAPEQVTSLVTAALKSPNGKQSRRLVTNPNFHQAAAMKPAGTEAEHQSRSYRYSPQQWQLAYRAADGSMIVFGGFTQQIHTRMDDGWWVKLGGSDGKILPGKYRSYTSTTRWQFVLRVPQHGKLALLSIESADADLSGTPFKNR